MPHTAFRVQPLLTETEAVHIRDFFLSGDSFDDANHTPGEIAHFQTHPFTALSGDYYYRFVRNEAGDIVAVNGFMENEQRTGGYYWDYVAVHKGYRGSGLASLLIRDMLDTLRGAGARYVLTYTCDLPSYDPIRKLFARHGFQLAGRCPDYYFEGEDRLIYHLKL